MSVIAEPRIEAPKAAETQFQRAWSEFSESRIAVAALIGVVLLIGLALLAPFVAPQNPYDLAVIDMFDSRLPPGSVIRFRELSVWERYRCPFASSSRRNSAWL